MAEAKENLTEAEIRSWSAFAEKHGPLWAPRRLEVALSLVAFTTARSMGSKNAKLEDFRIDWGAAQEAAPVSFEEFGAYFKSVVSGNKGKT